MDTWHGGRLLGFWKEVLAPHNFHVVWFSVCKRGGKNTVPFRWLPLIMYSVCFRCLIYQLSWSYLTPGQQLSFLSGSVSLLLKLVVLWLNIFAQASSPVARPHRSSLFDWCFSVMNGSGLLKGPEPDQPVWLIPQEMWVTPSIFSHDRRGEAQVQQKEYNNRFY